MDYGELKLFQTAFNSMPARTKAIFKEQILASKEVLENQHRYSTEEILKHAALINDITERIHIVKECSG